MVAVVGELFARMFSHNPRRAIRSICPNYLTCNLEKRENRSILKSVLSGNFKLALPIHIGTINKKKILECANLRILCDFVIKRRINNVALSFA